METNSSSSEGNWIEKRLRAYVVRRRKESSGPFVPPPHTRHILRTEVEKVYARTRGHRTRPSALLGWVKIRPSFAVPAVFLVLGMVAVGIHVAQKSGRPVTIARVKGHQSGDSLVPTSVVPAQSVRIGVQSNFSAEFGEPLPLMREQAQQARGSGTVPGERLSSNTGASVARRFVWRTPSGVDSPGTQQLAEQVLGDFLMELRSNGFAVVASDGSIYESTGILGNQLVVDSASETPPSAGDRAPGVSSRGLRDPHPRLATTFDTRARMQTEKGIQQRGTPRTPVASTNSIPFFVSGTNITLNRPVKIIGHIICRRESAQNAGTGDAHSTSDYQAMDWLSGKVVVRGRVVVGQTNEFEFTAEPR
ncbi:MAG: hypothetical protein N3G20_06735 [Verrucomicrobiae bacterium]|nr:hypothetical protein [Verrucomicrobiae bacterium]